MKRKLRVLNVCNLEKGCRIEMHPKNDIKSNFIQEVVKKEYTSSAKTVLRTGKEFLLDILNMRHS